MIIKTKFEPNDKFYTQNSHGNMTEHTVLSIDVRSSDGFIYVDTDGNSWCEEDKMLTVDEIKKNPNDTVLKELKEIYKELDDLKSKYTFDNRYNLLTNLCWDIKNRMSKYE